MPSVNQNCQQPNNGMTNYRIVPHRTASKEEETSVCNPGTTSESRDFGIGILQSQHPWINPGIKNPVKQPMATDQAERQRKSYMLHRPAY